MRAPLPGGAPKAPSSSSVTPASRKNGQGSAVLVQGNGQRTSKRALWIARMKVKSQARSEAKLAPYRTPEFAAKVERMKEGQAKEIARAVIAGGSVVEVTARFKVWWGTVKRTLRTIASGTHRSSPDNVRARTIAPRRLTRQEIQQGESLEPWLNIPRPKLREECKDGPRPCPFVSCRYHLYLDVNPETGSIKLNFPYLEVWQMKESCAMDVADRGGTTLEDVGVLMNLTRERVRQVEVRGLLKLKQEGVLLVGEAWRVREKSVSTVLSDNEEEGSDVSADKPRRNSRGNSVGSRYFGNAGFAKKAAQIPGGKHRDAALAVGNGELAVGKAASRLGLNYPQLVALFTSIWDGRYRPPTVVPPKPISRFATPEFAAKVKKVSWAKPKAKEIGRLAAAGMHVDLIAREQNRPVQDILAMLWAIENGTRIPHWGPVSVVRLETSETEDLGERSAKQRLLLPDEFMDVSVPGALRRPTTSPVRAVRELEKPAVPRLPAPPLPVVQTPSVPAPRATFHTDGTVTLKLALNWEEQQEER